MTSGQIEFENWLHDVWTTFQDTIRADPAKYKVTSRRGPGFPSFLVTPSRDEELYPNELRCRLLTKRVDGQEESACIASIECAGVSIDPTQVWSGSIMTPIFRLGYYKTGDDFGLTLTVLKAEYQPSVQVQINHHDYMYDTDSNTMGSSSSSSIPFSGDGVVSNGMEM